MYPRLKGGDPMRHMEIPNIPPTVSKSIRFPIDLVERSENVIRGKDCTFAAIVKEALRIAIEELEETIDND